MLSERFSNAVQIGNGGFGTVWRADTVDGVEVAVKVPNDDSAPTLARFSREVRLQSSLEHPNIVEILDYDLVGDDRWCAMPLADENFDEFVRDAGVSDQTILDAFRHVITGVEFAHEKHVLHRDLKPTNILVERTGDSMKAMVGDFGLSRKFTRGEMSFQTAKGAAYFSRWYSAPEQLSTFADVGVTADVYSLGRILEFCLAQRPMLSTSYPALERCVSVATRTDPAERYQSVSRFAAAFEMSSIPSSSLLRPVDQVRAVVAAALGRRDNTEILAELLAIYELHSDKGPGLQPMFSSTPYEMLDELAKAFPGQFRAVLRVYVETLSSVRQVQSAQRARDLLDHLLAHVDDGGLHAISIFGLLNLAAVYDSTEFADPALGWVYLERSPSVIAAIADELQSRPEVIAWLLSNATLEKLPPVIAALGDHG